MIDTLDGTDTCEPGQSFVQHANVALMETRITTVCKGY